LELVEASEFSTVESLQIAREAADSQAESKISKLPSIFQNPARELWKAKADSFQSIATSRMLSSADVALGISAAAIGSAAISSIESEDTQIGESEEVEAPAETKSMPDPVEQSQTTPSEDPQVSKPESENDTIRSIIESFSSARMLSEQNSLKEKFSGTQVNILVKISSVERSFGIGIDDRYRGGSTIIASLLVPSGGASSNSVEIRLPSDSDVSSFTTGYELEIPCMVDGWNSIRNTLILNAQ